MNHLEQLVAEWLQYNDYFVRVSVQVGPLSHGGFEGELDVVGFNMERQHLLHVECSLDALTAAERQARFQKKFERGRRYCKDVFKGLPTPEKLDQVVILLSAGDKVRDFGGGRLVRVHELVHEIIGGLRGTPMSGAVPSNLPLLRTLQLAAAAQKAQPSHHRLIPGIDASGRRST